MAAGGSAETKVNKCQDTRSAIFTTTDDTATSLTVQMHDGQLVGDSTDCSGGIGLDANECCGGDNGNACGTSQHVCTTSINIDLDTCGCLDDSCDDTLVRQLVAFSMQAPRVRSLPPHAPLGGEPHAANCNASPCPAPPCILQVNNPLSCSTSDECKTILAGAWAAAPCLVPTCQADKTCTLAAPGAWDHSICQAKYDAAATPYSPKPPLQLCERPMCQSDGSCGTGAKPANTPCRSKAGECDEADVCNGTSLTCTDTFAPAGTDCGNADNVGGPCDAQDK